MNVSSNIFDKTFHTHKAHNSKLKTLATMTSTLRPRFAILLPVFFF